MQAQYNNILIIRMSALGDAVNLFPLLPLIRQAWPQARISFLTSPMLTGLMKTDEMIDEVIPHNRSRGLLNILTSMYHLRSQRFDLVLDLQSSRYSRWLAWATGATTRVANRAGFFYTHPAQLDPTRYQASQHFLNMLSVIGIPQQKLSPRFPALETCVTKAKSLLEVHGLTSGEYIVFNPGHSPQWRTKRWPVEHWKKLTRYCSEQGMPVVITGSNEEQQVAQEIMASDQGKVISVAGETSLQQLAGVMAGARAVVSTDSGPMHVAAMVNTPVVALFGPTNPVPSAPFGDQHKIMHHELECSRCFKKQCPFQHECLDQMSADEVWRAMQEIISKDQ